MKSNNAIKLYGIGMTLLAIAFIIENRNLNRQLDEELIIKYEYSAIIDSLIYEIENPNQNEK